MEGVISNGTIQGEASGGEEDALHISTALNLAWSFGINKQVPVLNLSNAHRKSLFYVTVHTGVLYDFKSNSQILYQGHCNSISCTCVSSDKRWLATADVGKDCMAIIWDTETSVPIRTLFDVDPVGVVAMAFSSDAKFLAVVSCTLPQVLTVWDWTTESAHPCASINLDEEFGLQTYICFNTSDPSLLVTNNGNQVVFYKWSSEGDMIIHAPELSDQDFNKTVGSYNQSVFHPATPIALTATSCGNIVVWTITVTNSSIETKALKIVKIQDKGISVLYLLNELIVTGDVAGNVKFFDLELKLINWYNKFGSQGTINSISFSYDPDQLNTLPQQEKVPTSATLESKQFAVNDFSVGTTKANLLYFDTSEGSVRFIRKHHDKDIKAIACHPKQSYLAIGGFDGLLQIIDFDSKTSVHTKQFSEKNTQITCLTYSFTGDFLAVGFGDGQVQILDSLTLELDGDGETKSTFHHSHDEIVKLVFSYDSSLLACYDKDRCVVVFKFLPDNKAAPWEYIGKHRAHYKQIVDIMFVKSLDEKSSRLMSIGEDRMLVEYDLKNSSVDDLKVLSSDRIEQNAIPTCFASYPPVVKEDFIVVANDQYKLKLFNSTTKMCRHTYLGPTYGSSVRALVPLPVIPNAPNRYVAYITSDKVGLIILPLDGNPHNSMALIAHPGQVHNIVCSYDGKYVFTAGGADTTVLMWKVDVDALQGTAALGGEGLVPFFSLLEGGRDGDLFAELETYFYYAQIRNQGIDAMERRAIDTRIPLSEIPFIMRALGYYPTEQEIDEMVNEVKFSSYAENGQYVETVDIGGLLKLYLNHRPAFGMNPEDLIDAFKKIGYLDANDEVKIDRADLLHLLQEKGEHLSENELGECITMLLECGGSDSEDDEEAPLDEVLPEQISLEYFTSDLLGFGSPAEITSQY